MPVVVTECDRWKLHLIHRVDFHNDSDGITSVPYDIFYIDINERYQRSQTDQCPKYPEIM